MYKVLCVFVSSIIILGGAQTQVDVDKLFHANPPSLTPSRPANANTQKIQQSSNEPSNNIITDLFDDDFSPFRGSRHDEFDWALIKVFCIKK